MSALTEVQIIKQGGKPAFAVIPYEEYLRLTQDDDARIPHEVVGRVIKKNMTLVKAWRTHLGLTQKQVADRAGISQAALSQMENSANKLRPSSLQKLAAAMGLLIGQIVD